MSAPRAVPAPGGAANASGGDSFAPAPPSARQNDAGRADWHRQVAAHDRKTTAAYQAGRSGMPADPDYDDDESAAHASGAEEAAQPAAAPPTPASSSPGSPGPSSRPSLPSLGATRLTAQGAPLLLGAVGYCVAINWFRYGWPGVTGWFTAKFENKVTLGTAKDLASAVVTTGGGHATTTAPGSVTGSDQHGTHGK